MRGLLGLLGACGGGARFVESFRLLLVWLALTSCLPKPPKRRQNIGPIPVKGHAFGAQAWILSKFGLQKLVCQAFRF